MSEIDADRLLRRALSAHARQAGVALAFTGGSATGWASAVFSGARHDLELVVAGSGAVAWLRGLPEAELGVRGQLVADLTIVAVRTTDGGCAATIEVLTVEER